MSRISLLKYKIILLVVCITAVAFAGYAKEPGYLIVLNKSGDSAMIIDLKTDKPIATLPTGHAPHEVAVSANGKTAVVCNYGKKTPGNSLTVIDLPNKKVVETIDLGQYQRPHGIQFLGKSRRFLVTAERQKHLLLMNLDKKSKNKIVKAFPTEQEISHMVAATPDGRIAFTANIRSGSVSVIDLEKGERVANIPTGAGAEGLDVSPDGKEAWVTNRAEDTISVIDVATLKIKKTLKCGSFPIRLKFTVDGKEALVSCAKSGELVIFDTQNYKELHRLPFKVEAAADSKERLFKDQFKKSPVPIGILIHPNGKWAYVASAYIDRVAVVNIKNRKLIKWIVTGKEPDGLGFTYLTN